MVKAVSLLGERLMQKLTTVQSRAMKNSTGQHEYINYS
jgi:hypothetical protein